METTTELDLQATTLAGDIRDMLLTHIRSMETPWSKLSEQQQRDRIEAAASAGRDLVRRSVQIVAHRGFAHMPITLKDWTVKDGIQLKVSALDTVEEITKLAEHKSGSALIVFASSSAFLGARAEVEPDRDQPELPMHDEDGVIAEGPVADFTFEQAEDMVSDASSLKGMTVRLTHFAPSARRDALTAAIRAKGGNVILQDPEQDEQADQVEQPEPQQAKPKRRRTTVEERVLARRAEVEGTDLPEAEMPAAPELADA